MCLIIPKLRCSCFFWLSICQGETHTHTHAYARTYTHSRECFAHTHAYTMQTQSNKHTRIGLSAETSRHKPKLKRATPTYYIWPACQLPPPTPEGAPIPKKLLLPQSVSIFRPASWKFFPTHTHTQAQAGNTHIHTQAHTHKCRLLSLKTK